MDINFKTAKVTIKDEESPGVFCFSVEANGCEVLYGTAEYQLHNKCDERSEYLHVDTNDDALSNYEDLVDALETPIAEYQRD